MIKDRIRKWRRDRLADRIVVNGEALDRLYRERALIVGFDSYIDTEIERRERRADQLLTKFKEA